MTFWHISWKSLGTTNKRRQRRAYQYYASSLGLLICSAPQCGIERPEYRSGCTKRCHNLGKIEDITFHRLKIGSQATVALLHSVAFLVRPHIFTNDAIKTNHTGNPQRSCRSSISIPLKHQTKRASGSVFGLIDRPFLQWQGWASLIPSLSSIARESVSKQIRNENEGALFSGS